MAEGRVWELGEVLGHVPRRIEGRENWFPPDKGVVGCASFLKPRGWVQT